MSTHESHLHQNGILTHLNLDVSIPIKFQENLPNGIEEDAITAKKSTNNGMNR